MIILFRVSQQYTPNKTLVETVMKVNQQPKADEPSIIFRAENNQIENTAVRATHGVARRGRMTG